jgi:hypothetical protein
MHVGTLKTQPLRVAYSCIASYSEIRTLAIQHIKGQNSGERNNTMQYTAKSSIFLYA